MKKLKSLSLLLLGMGMASCAFTPEEDLYTGKESYMHAFINEFGVIDPNHTWGFGTPDRPQSRGTSMNGNEYKDPPTVTEEEIRLVMNYLDKGRSTYETIPEINYTDYYCTHVAGGGQTYTKDEGNTVPQPKTYTNIQNGTGNTAELLNFLHIQEDKEASMDDLSVPVGETVGESEGWVHVNNFNAASNANYSGNTMMENSGTWDFAIYNSLDSRYHNRYVIIDGGKIHSSLAGYTYVCFDFDAHPNSFKSNFAVSYRGKKTITQDNSQKVTFYNATYSGSWNAGETWPTGWPEINDFVGQMNEDLKKKYDDGDLVIKSINFDNNNNSNTEFTVNYTTYTYQYEDMSFNAEYSEYYPMDDNTTWPTYADLFANKGKEYNEANVQDLSVSLSYSEGDKYVFGDNIYNDWVIRLINGLVPINKIAFWEEAQLDNTWKRIMVEDLSVAANWQYTTSANASDWDFNDLVIDAKILESGEAQIVMKALGGTLPIYIGTDETNITDELHILFDVPVTTMVNTGYGKSLDDVDLTTEVKDMRFTDLNSIKIFIEKDGDLVELTAPTGQAPSKICVPHTVKWAAERQNMESAHPGFADWVSDEGKTQWQYLMDEEQEPSTGNGD